MIPARLRDARRVLRLTQEELGERVGVSRQAISAFELGDKNPEPQTFSALAAVLGQPIGFFTTEDRPKFGESTTRFYRKFGPDTVRRNEAAEIFSDWFVQVSKYFDDIVVFPDVALIQHPKDPDSALDDIDDIADQVRKSWGLGFGPISNVAALLEAKGIILCRYEMTGENVEAFSFWNGRRPFVFMASEKKAGVRTRFDLAHELGHLVLHRHIEKTELEDRDTLKKIEAQADRFAGAFLLPRLSYPNEVFTAKLDAFVDLKRRWLVSIQAMIYRCADLGIFDENQILRLRKQISFRKWRTEEPLDDPRSIRLEQPQILRRSLEAAVNSGRLTAEEIVQSIQISPRFIELMCGLQEGALPDGSPTEHTE